MMIVSIEKHGMNRVKGACVRAVLKGRACEPCYRSVRASRVNRECVGRHLICDSMPTCMSNSQDDDSMTM